MTDRLYEKLNQLDFYGMAPWVDQWDELTPEEKLICLYCQTWVQPLTVVRNIIEEKRSELETLNTLLDIVYS